jgi:hypothetical protein
MLTVLSIARRGPSGAPSKCDLHEDTLRFLLNARVNTHGFTIVESLAIHSRRVELALDPIVTKTSKQQCNFFFFLGVWKKGDDENNLITPLTMNASMQSKKQVTMTPHTDSRQLTNMHKITRRMTTLPTQTRPCLQVKGQHPHPDIIA